MKQSARAKLADVFRSPYECPSCGMDACDAPQIRWRGDGYMECPDQDCGEEFQYQPVSQPKEFNQPLFHCAPRHNRESIQQHGLERYTEGIYMDTEECMPEWKRYVGGPGAADVWQIHPQGLPIHENELDGLFTTHPVGPERLTLREDL